MQQFELIPSSRKRSAAERMKLLEKPVFGKVFTDHMATVEWTEEKGWHDAKIRALEPFTLDPASAVLHYAQEIFEGMKAYRGADDAVWLFRPQENARRFQLSAKRLAMPELPTELFLESIERLVQIDAAWVPKGWGSLYLRPFMFANEVFLGVRPAKTYIYCVIASPVGDYFKGGAKPISVWASTQYSRAGVGGTGAAKCGGNYAGSLPAQAQAIKHDCDQVVFLDAAERRWVEELGGMNIFFVMKDGSMKTPPLGTILPGITRASVIELARAQGVLIEEAPYSFDQWSADAKSGDLAEVFVCGTAAVIAAVGRVCSEAGEITIADGQAGPITCALRDKLVAIQRGESDDMNEWRYSVLPYPGHMNSICAKL